MKDKKAHEVENVLKFLLPKLNKHKIDLILDIGCGKGYTSYVIAASNPNIKIHGIDSKKANIKEFNKRINNIALVHAGRICSSPENYRSRFCLKTLFVDEAQVSIISKELKETVPMLMTLHGCGNLSSTLIRMFGNLKELKQLLLISCCFNLLTEQVTEEAKKTPAYNLYLEHMRNDLTIKDTGHNIEGFPMSEYMRKRHPEFFLGRIIRCAAAASFAFLIEEPQRSEAFVKMLYRSALEVIVGVSVIGVYER